MLMQNVGVRNKEHYGMLWYFLEWSIVIQTSNWKLTFLTILLDNWSDFWQLTEIFHLFIQSILSKTDT